MGSKVIITEYELTDAEVKMLDGDVQVDMYERFQADLDRDPMLDKFEGIWARYSIENDC